MFSATSTPPLSRSLQPRVAVPFYPKATVCYKTSAVIAKYAEALRKISPQTRSLAAFRLGLLHPIIQRMFRAAVLGRHHTAAQRDECTDHVQ